MRELALECQAFLDKKRPVLVLVLISFFIGCGFSASLFNVDFILGTGEFWRFPQGTIENSQNDMAATLAGYYYIVQEPWAFPILYLHKLGFPAGVNALWIDPIPWLALTGRMIYTVTGSVVNLTGCFVALCFALNGTAIVLLLASVGERSIAAAVLGSLIALATPWLLFRFGHNALLFQFSIVISMALYVWNLKNPRNIKFSSIWILGVTLLFFTQIYLFAMIFVVWISCLIQNTINNRSYLKYASSEFMCFVALFFSLLYSAGYLNENLGQGGTSEYGKYAMNVLSPLVPQMSGVLFPFSQYYMFLYEGYAYLGAGVIFLGIVSISSWATWVRTRILRHIVLLCGFLTLLALAVTNQVVIGRWHAVVLPLPEIVLQMLGTFRASGRFFWPIGYAIMAGSIIFVLRNKTRPASLVILTVAAVLQIIDVQPMRAAIAQAVAKSPPPLLDRAQTAPYLDVSQNVVLYPSYSCVRAYLDAYPLNRETIEARWYATLELQRANVEFQLLTARRNMPINSVYNPRARPDCPNEDRDSQANLHPGTLYVYLDRHGLDAPGVGGRETSPFCRMVGRYLYCLVPKNVSGRI